MTGRRRQVGAAAGILLVAAAGWWWLRDGRPRGEERAGGSAATRARRLGRSGTAPGGLSWLGSGVDERPVAGRVTYKGAPVPGAAVRLELAGELRLLAAPLLVTAGPDGEFDFGPHAAVEVVVSASAAGRAAAGTTIDLRDPTLKPDRLELELGDCARTVAGTVRDSGGGPVAGAAVRVSIGDEIPGVQREAPLAVTAADADGGYQLCLRPGEGRMTVEADGYARAELELGGERRIRRDVELSPEAEIAGVVLGPDQRPAAGALVIGRAADMADMISGDVAAISDDRGRFSIGGLAPVRLALRALGDGLATGEEVEVAARVGGAGEEAILRLQPAARVRGRVIEEDRPVAGARVVHLPPGGTRFNEVPFLAPEVVTAADGSFALDGVRPGPFEILVRDHDVVDPVAPVAAANGPALVVRVTAQARLRGRVLRQGAPVPGAIVRVASGWLSRASPADAEGRYDLRGLSAGTYTVVGRAEGASSRALPITLARGQLVDRFDIALEVTGAIAGVVVDQSGRPVAGAAVNAQPRAPRASPFRATSEENGSFTIGGLAAGEYGVTVRRRRSSPVDLAPAGGAAAPSVTVVDGEVASVRIAVQIDRLRVGGSVREAGGQPAPDVRVRAIPASVYSDDNSRRMSPYAAEVRTAGDGTFALDDLDAGRYALMAISETGMEAIEKEVAAGREDVRLVLPEPGTVEGELVGFGTGARVTARPAAFLERFPGAVSGGRFTIRGLAAGPYIVQAREGARIAEVMAEVVAGETAKVTLTSDGIATVRGRAIDRATGAAVPGAHCGVAGGVGITGNQVIAAGADGRFELSVPARRKASVACVAGASRSGSSPVTLEPGATADVVVQMAERRR